MIERVCSAWFELALPRLGEVPRASSAAGAGCGRGLP